jgi:chitinase domain-containing protein 1
VLIGLLAGGGYSGRAFADEVANAVDAASSAVGEAAQRLQFSSPDLKYPDFTSTPSVSAPNVQIPDDVSQLIASNPALLFGGVALLAVPLIAIGLSGSGAGGKVKSVSAKQAFQQLSGDEPIVFVDIRSKAEIKEQGTPDLRSTGKKGTSLPYTKVVGGETVVDEAFADRLVAVRGIDEDATLLLLDSNGQEAKEAGQLIAEAVQRVLYVAGGAEGPSGWKASELPWKEPSKGLLDLGKLGETIDDLAEDFKGQPTLTKAGLAAGALGAGLLLLFNEVGTAVEVLGAVAVGQFAFRNLLFNKDRDEATKQVKALVDDKIGLKDVPKDLSKVSRAIADTGRATEKKAESVAKSRVPDSAKQTAQDVKKELGTAASAVKQDTSRLASDAKKEAGKTGNELQKDASKATNTLQKEGSKAADNLQKEGSKAADNLQKEGSKAGDNLQKDAKNVQKDASKAADSLQKDASKATDNLQKDASKATSNAKQQASSAAKDVQQQTKQAQEETKQAAKPVEAKAQSSKQQFEKQRDEVVKESKENIKEAEKTIKNQGTASAPGAASANGAKSEGAPSARAWIDDWYAKQDKK